jgi:hypothetical protein
MNFQCLVSIGRTVSIVSETKNEVANPSRAASDTECVSVYFYLFFVCLFFGWLVKGASAFVAVCTCIQFKTRQNSLLSHQNGRLKCSNSTIRNTKKAKLNRDLSLKLL